MEANNYSGVHILSEAVIMGGITMYFYKEISELKSTIEDLKSQITMQNNQIRYLLTSHVPQQSTVNTIGIKQPSTPLRIGTFPTLSTLQYNNGISRPQKEFFNNLNEEVCNNASQYHQTYLNQTKNMQKVELPSSFALSQNMECKDGVCHLVQKKMVQTSIDLSQTNKKVMISKISKQIEFDRENISQNHTSKVSTFTKFSPNPLLKSVTPKPSTSINPLDHEEDDYEVNHDHKKDDYEVNHDHEEDDYEVNHDHEEDDYEENGYEVNHDHKKYKNHKVIQGHKNDNEDSTTCLEKILNAIVDE
jgi:hypothetical protein